MRCGVEAQLTSAIRRGSSEVTPRCETGSENGEVARTRPVAIASAGLRSTPSEPDRGSAAGFSTSSRRPSLRNHLTASRTSSTSSSVEIETALQVRMAQPLHEIPHLTLTHALIRELSL
jgi:hypothetical protein